MTAIAWAIITAAMIYADTQHSVFYKTMEYTNYKFVGGFIFVCWSITILCTFIEWTKK